VAVSGASGQPENLAGSDASTSPATRSEEMTRNASTGGAVIGNFGISSDISPDPPPGNMGVVAGVGVPLPASAPPNSRADLIWGKDKWEFCTRPECCADIN
jgi:hypothetical protein